MSSMAYLCIKTTYSNCTTLTQRRFIFVNNIWDRIEKGIYLAIDAALNWYFLRVVKANLINNGLQKYGKLLRFNQRIIALSLLMDVMIIAAMSIPNSFVYAPLPFFSCHVLTVL